MNEELMRIGDFADFFHISRKSLRLYEQKGIIKPAKIDENTGYRYYSADQAKHIHALLELKLLGFTLDEIKHLMNQDLSSEELYTVMEKKKNKWQEQIQIAENRIDAIDQIAARIEAVGNIQNTQVLTEEERALLLVKMVCVEDLSNKNILREAIWL